MPIPPNSSVAAPPGGSGEMFDQIAERYDLLNRVMSLGIDRGWRRRLVAALELGAEAQVLDLATGTGDVALEILRQQPTAAVVGIDPSARMLAVAGEKLARRGHTQVELRAGSAEALPIADDSLDGLSIAFGIRNVADRRRALAEMARVVRPDGRIAILELGEPRNGPLACLARFHIHHLVPRLGAWLSGAAEYRYLQRSIAAFPPPTEFAALMAECGLEVLRLEPLTFGVVCLYVARPAAEAN